MEKLPAIKCIQNDKVFYLTSMNASLLKDICYLLRREEELEIGFQRNLNKARANDIKDYLVKEKGSIPAALILSAKGEACIEYSDGFISFKKCPKTFMVLDGQHRLFGLTLALEDEKKDFEIPVIIYVNLPVKEEVSLFIDINTTQKGVSPSLLLDIKNLAGRETPIEEKQSYLFDRLNENGILANKLSPIKQRTGFISKTAFFEATNKLLTTGLFSTKDKESVLKGLRVYLEAVNTVLIESKSKNAKITNTNIFKAIMSIFNDVIDISLLTQGNISKDSLITVLKPISKLPYDEYILSSNKATLTRIISEMTNEIKGYTNNYKKYSDEDLFGC